MDTKKTDRISWVFQVVAAVILGQTLFFKFSGAEETVYIFETLGVEPWGRLASAGVELVAVVLLLLPRLNWVGAVIGLGVMGGALFSHLTVLGIDVRGDGGLLFSLAVVTALSCATVLFLRRSRVCLSLGTC